MNICCKPKTYQEIKYRKAVYEDCFHKANIHSLLVTKNDRNQKTIGL